MPQNPCQEIGDVAEKQRKWDTRCRKGQGVPIARNQCGDLSRVNQVDESIGAIAMAELAKTVVPDRRCQRNNRVRNSSDTPNHTFDRSHVLIQREAMNSIADGTLSLKEAGAGAYGFIKQTA